MFALTAMYAGVLLARVRNYLQPNCVSYADLGAAIIGRRFAILTRCCTTVTWALLLPYYLLTCTNAIRGAFPHLRWCPFEVSLLCTGMLLLPLQMRNLHAICADAPSNRLLPSRRLATAANALPHAPQHTSARFLPFACLQWSALSRDRCSQMASMVVRLLLWGRRTDRLFSTHTARSAPSFLPSRRVSLATGPAPCVRLTLGVCFSRAIISRAIISQGQSIFCEIMREMKDSRQFPRSLTIANGIMMGVYIFISSVAYGALLLPCYSPRVALHPRRACHCR